MNTLKPKFRDLNYQYSKSAPLFLLPLFLIIGVFLIFSIFFILRNGFYKMDLSFNAPVFVGFKNYRMLLSDPHFYHSIMNNFIFALVVVISGITLGFFLAVILSLDIPFSKVVFALVFIPAILPRALIATVFRQMFEFHTGTVNGMLSSLGLAAEGMKWLTNPALAYVSVMSLFIYMIGIPLLYYNADLASIPQSIIESARIDGAGLFTVMTRIIYPLVSSSHKTIIISSVLSSFRMFEAVFLLTRSGPGFTTEISGTYIYRFTRQGTQIGFVCAASTVVLIVALIIAVIQTALLYNKEKK